MKQIPDELEVMLGVSRAKSDHRKPQHVLYLYETEQIDPAKLQAFCLLVEARLPTKSSTGSADRARNGPGMTTFTEFVVEQAALAWLESAGQIVRNGAETTPGEATAERDAYG